MSDLDFRALDEYALIARALHDVEEVDSRTNLFGLDVPSPILPLLGAQDDTPAALALLECGADRPNGKERRAERRPEHTIPLLAAASMGELIRAVKDLAGEGHPALALDLRSLAGTPPFGQAKWRPRAREELAELRAAADSPLIVLGIASAADAEVAVEAGLEGIVVHSALAAHLGGPAAISVLPEIVDAVAGMTGVYAGGPVRSGIDVFRYLAVGAEAVVVESDRSLANLEGELHYAMRLTACATVSDIGYEQIFERLFDEA